VEKMPVSIRSLAEDTGETIRSLQNWCDLGVLIAEPSTEKKGRGYHRVFKDDERKWALLAAALNKLRVPLGDVAKYLEYMRRHYKGERFNSSAMAQALKSDYDVFLMLSLRQDEKGLRVRASLFPPLNAETDDPILKAAFKSQCVETVVQMLKFSRENPESGFLNLTQIWAPLRRPA
jgi:DNA-binding transcriptional MerR regulator